MTNNMRIGIQKLRNAKTVAQVDKIEEKTCMICAFQNRDDVSCKRCPFRIEADIRRYAIRKGEI